MRSNECLEEKKKSMTAVKIKQFGERVGSLLKSLLRGLGSGYEGEQWCHPCWLPGGSCLEAAAGKESCGFRKVCDVHSTAVSFLSVLLQGLRK